MTNILLLENDMFLAGSLIKILEHNGYRVSQARSIERANELIYRQRFDLALCDRVLDDGDGLDIVRYLHKTNYATRIIMLTQKKSLSDKLLGFETGVDDYLAKPFSFKELSFRIKSLLKKEKVVRNSTMTAGELNFSVEKGEIKTKTELIFLRRKESLILECLFNHKNNTVTRSRLINTVWPDVDNQPTKGTVDVYIRRIRMKLGEYGPLLRTVRGFGYRIIDPQV